MELSALASAADSQSMTINKAQRSRSSRSLNRCSVSRRLSLDVGLTQRMGAVDSVNERSLVLSEIVHLLQREEYDPG